MISSLLALWDDDRGATMVEYALVLLFVATAAFAAVTVFGLNVRALFEPATTAFR